MNRKLQYEINAIQQHINRNYKRWFATYSKLEGVHVGQKRVNSKTVKNQYSVVFHVIRKKKKPAKSVPRFIHVRLRGKSKLKVQTDVIEAGRIKFNGIMMGEQAKNENSSLFGTISFYFVGAQGTYLGSNMHVLAPDLIKRGQINYDARNGDQPQSISFFNDTTSSTAQLVVAKFDGIDFGIAKIADPKSPEIFERLIKDVGPVKGTQGLTLSNVNSFNLSFYGSSSKFRGCTVSDLGVVKNAGVQNVFLTNLIKLNKCTLDGDSGAPVFNQNNKVVGIIIGEDNDGSYALNILDVIKFFQTSNL